MTNYKVGDLAEKYETSNRGPGYISNGSSWGDPGGDSYGSYQIETKKGTMQEYLKGSDRFIDSLKTLSINSAAFKGKWKELAVQDPEGFQQSQFDFLSKKPNGFNDCVRYAEKLGININSFAMLSALFSTSNQSGGWKKILDRAHIVLHEDTVNQINKLYDSRAAYFKSLDIPTAVRVSIVQNRTVDERKDCIKLLSRGNI